jgi:hypothetical protein
MVGGYIGARLSQRGVVANDFDDTEVEEVRKFVAIGRPIGGFTRGEVVEI